MSSQDTPSGWRLSYKPYLIVDADSWTVVDANYAAEEFWGYGPSRLLGLPLVQLLDEAAVERIDLRARCANQRSFSSRGLSMRQSTTAVHSVDLQATPFGAEPVGRRWMMRFREAGNRGAGFEVARVYWARGAYARSMAALLTVESPAEVMSKVCGAIVAQEPYIIACVALKQFDERKTVLIAARAGPARSYLHDIRLNWSDEHVYGSGATGRALRSGVPVVIGDTATDPVFAPWRERCTPYGIRSTVTVPFRRLGEVAGALLVYANTVHAFGPRELSLFVQLGLEISFAMTFHESRRQLDNAIAARRLAETQLEQARSELQRAERNSFVGEFSAAIAHEINQPLTSIRTNAEASLRWLSRPVPDLEEAKRAISRAVVGAELAADVMSRIRRMYTNDRLPHVRLELVEAVRRVIVVARDRLVENDIEVQETYSHEPLFIDGDRLQLQQVVFNLVSNAIDAVSVLRDEPRRIEVRARRSAEGAALVEVQDNGLGVDPAIGERLFTRFASSKPKGMGLGLVISKSILEAHDGEIWSTPVEPRGTTFSFAIPLARKFADD